MINHTDRLYFRYTPNLTSPLDTHVEIWVERYFVALVYSERSEGTVMMYGVLCDC